MNKEIIIDGVDVSKCKHLVIDNQNNKNSFCADIFKNCRCEEIKDCYYKQLQQAKQKLETSKITELEVKIIFLEKEVKESKYWYKQLKEEKNQLTEENVFLNQTLKACEEEHRKLTKKYNELVNQL